MTAGEVSDYIGARALLGSLPNVEWLLGDRGYDAGLAEHAYEMDTSELHRTSILLAACALTTDRSMHPGEISQEDGSVRKAAEKEEHLLSATRQSTAYGQNCLTGTAPLPKS